MDQAVLGRSVGCKTYMGVLSLHGWRGKVTVLILYQSTGQTALCLQHIQTYTYTHTHRLTRTHTQSPASVTGLNTPRSVIIMHN